MITIIVLLILAGASIATITGYDSIPDNAQIAVKASKLDTTLEQNIINIVDAKFKQYLPTLLPDYNETKIPEKKAPKDTVIKVINQDGSGGDWTYNGQTKTFENVEINTTENNGTYSGFAGMTGTFENCTINGRFALYADCTFINCEFNITGDDYNIWTWGAGNIKFVNCNFFSDGKGLFVYGGGDQNITIEDCVFVDNGGLEDLKAAIEIGNDYNRSYNLNIKNTTVIGYEINNKGINTGTTLWANKNSMGQDKLNVVVDGVDVY